MVAKLVPLVLRNLGRNRRRTLLTILSIGVSIFVFAALASLPMLVDQILRDRANSLRVITHSKVSVMYQLPVAYLHQVKSVPHVEAVSAYTLFLATYRDPSVQLPAIAVTPENFRQIWPDWGLSEATEQKFLESRSACMVTRALMRQYGWKIGDNVILHGTMYPIDLQIKIVGEVGDRAPGVVIIFRSDYLDELIGRPGKVNIIWSKIDSSHSTQQVMADIDRMFANSADETQTETETAMVKNRVGEMSLMINGAKALAAIVIFAIALVAANTAAMAVRERRGEIAVMRAIGFSRDSIVVAILGEGVAIGILGGLVGCAMARAGFVALPYLAAELGPIALQLKMSARVLISSFAVATIIGAASSLVPAFTATRGSVARSLRPVG
ncbi:MAG: FtsX-like permease family protein [Candidatus Binatus sp.]|uniref:ABC transporter permease n=1 Tax=Candidatus Binatus sp. TaxID=2811406 RepID=UPI0027239516|nr:FtsX-like permease family protein [Candidatus Binatus sp.]MDO8432033.1 FtsX-like permease family protein [Candidatus Binatus sp.]